MINKGDSAYFVFQNGTGVKDSQGKQYVYKSERSFERYFPFQNYGEDVELIEYAPVKRGKWEEIKSPYGEIEGWLCVCGQEVKSKYNCCPNCGAKMDMGE